MSPAHIEGDHGDPHAKATVIVYAITLAGAALAVIAFVASMRFITAHHLGLAAVVGASLVYGVALIGAVLLAVAVARRAVGGGRMTPPAARYGRRVLIAMSLYVVTLALAIGGFLALPHGSPLAYVVAVAPAIPLVGVIVAMARYLREETDEFERMVQAEAALWATGGLLTLATVWGFLERFGLAPHAESYFAVVIWFLLLGPCQVIVRRRYR